MKTSRIFPLIVGSIVVFAVFLSLGQNANSQLATNETINSRVHILADNINANKVISRTYKAQVGKKTTKPSIDQSKLKPSSCDVTCDMFVPRQAVIHFNIPKANTIKTQGVERKATIRVDVTALSDGFDSGSFHTVELQNIDKLEFLPQSSSIPLKVNSQVLFNQVDNWKIVDRPEEMPIYRSQDLMLKSLPSMAKPLQAIIKEELRIGSLNQARILGRTEQMVKGKAHDVISIVGMAPGMTYQFRAVNEAISTAKTLSVAQCHIPVCPADFVQ